MFQNNMVPNNMAQRFKITGFVFNIFIIMIQYIIIINSSDKINIMKQHIGKIDENKTNYNFEDRFDKFDNLIIKMVIKSVDYIHNKITEQPTINPLPTNPLPTNPPPTVNPLPTVNAPPTLNPLPTNNFNKITHLIPHYDNNSVHNEILHNGWCPLCACKNSKSDLCKGISSIMYSLIINFDGVCSLCPAQYLIDVEEHILADSAFLNKNLDKNKLSGLLNVYYNQGQLSCEDVFRQSFYKELKSSAIYTEMIGCINNPNSNYYAFANSNYYASAINNVMTELKSLFVIRWFWLENDNKVNYVFRKLLSLSVSLSEDQSDKLRKFLFTQVLLLSIDGKILTSPKLD